MTGRLMNTSAIALVATLAITQQSKAQNTDDELVADEIIVEGELQSRTLQDTQTSVTVITGEELERRSDVSLRSVAERVPGVSTSARGIGFVIRGVDERGVDANGPSSPAVTTSIDGARITDFGRINTSFLSTWDLEQVEFLRGPQSTQSGRNALAGAVIVRSADPSFDEEFKLRAGLGNFRTFEGAFAANMPLIDDTLAMRLSGDFRTTDGFIENTTTGEADDGGVESLNVRGSLRFEPTDNFSAVLKLSHIESTDGFASSDRAAFPRREVTTDAPTQDEMDYQSANLRLSYDFTDELSFESESVLTDRRFVFRGDFDGTGLPLATAVDDAAGQSFSQEIKLFYENEWLSGVLGAFYLQSEETSNTIGTIPSALFAPPAFVPFLTPGTTISAVGVSDVEVQNMAVFGELEAEVSDGVRLIVGGRYDRETQDRSSFGTISTNEPLLIGALPPQTPEKTSTTFQAFLPKAGIVYEFTDDVSLGFTFQQGYRAGGAGTNLARGETFEFDPEFTNNYELSLRSQWLDDRLTVNANAYFVQYRDQQVVIELSTSPLDQETQNAGKSRSFGGELEVQATPFAGLDLYASIGYNQTEFLDFVSNGVQLAGNEFRNAPEWTGAVGGTYFFDQGWLDGFYVGADASYTSSSFSDAANSGSLRSDQRTILNLRAGYETEHFNVFGYVNNLGDTTYVEESGATLVTIGAPLTVGLIGQVEF